MISDKVYQSIYDELRKYLISGWEKMIVYLEYGNASYTFSFFVKDKKGYTKCFDLPGVQDKELDASFKVIDALVSKERNKEKQPWSNMTMIIGNDGDMHSDFDYTDLSEGTYQFKKNWKKKYLV